MLKATMTKTQDAQVSGPYKPTAVDEAKAKADFRIIDAMGGSYTLRAGKHVDFDLSGRGIKSYTTPGTYEVSSKALDKICATYNVVTDF